MLQWHDKLQSVTHPKALENCGPCETISLMEKHVENFMFDFDDWKSIPVHIFRKVFLQWRANFPPVDREKIVALRHLRCEVFFTELPHLGGIVCFPVGFPTASDMQEGNFNISQLKSKTTFEISISAKVDSREFAIQSAGFYAEFLEHANCNFN